jgi:diguanylate cyclase (GGDEF)-like protein/PAS domain S-box-containing protein
MEYTNTDINKMKIDSIFNKPFGSDKSNELIPAKIQLDSILSSVKNALWSLSWPERKAYYISPSIENIYGYSVQEFENNASLWYEVIHPDDKEIADKALSQLEKYGESIYNVRIIKKDGSTAWIEDQGKAVYDENGEVIRIEGIVTDITQQKEYEKKLEYQLKYEHLLADVSSHFITESKEKFVDQVDYSLRKISEFFKIDRSYIFLMDEEQEKMIKTHDWYAEESKAEIYETENISTAELSWWFNQFKENGHIFISDLSELPDSSAEKNILKAQKIKSLLAVPIYKANNLYGFISFDSIQDNSAFKENQIMLLKVLTNIIANAYNKHLTEDKIRQLNIQDSLTGVFNRSYFIEKMKELDNKANLPIGIILTDINGLKIINDSYGHIVGDKIIKETAEMLRSALRNKDLIGRWGGDEFIILMPGKDKTAVEFMARQLKTLDINCQTAECADSFKEKISISLSAGSAVKDNEGQMLCNIIKKADQAIYEDKLTNSQSNKNKIIQSLLSTLRAKSDETEKHSLRMTELSQKLGRKVGLDNQDLHLLALMANIHDIGKITIPENILNKPGKLNEEEWKLLKTHPAKGAEIARASEEFAPAAEYIKAHHERWDGSGYPDGLKAEEIPLLARILSIVDSYDVMINERPYKEPMTKEEAKKELKRCAGTQFDPELVEEFLAVLENEES